MRVKLGKSHKIWLEKRPDRHNQLAEATVTDAGIYQDHTHTRYIMRKTQEKITKFLVYTIITV